MQTGKTAENNV